MNTAGNAKREPPEWAALRHPRQQYDYSNRAPGWAASLVRAHLVAIFDERKAETWDVGPSSSPAQRPTDSTGPGSTIESLVERLDVAAPVRRAATRVVEAFSSQGLRPDRLVRSAGGGIALYFFGPDLLPDGSHRRLASIEVDEDGETTALFKDRVTGAAEVLDLPDQLALAQAIAAVSTFLQG